MGRDTMTRLKNDMNFTGQFGCLSPTQVALSGVFSGALPAGRVLLLSVEFPDLLLVVQAILHFSLGVSRPCMGPPMASERRNFWRNLPQRVSRCPNAKLFIGDLNGTLADSDIASSVEGACKPFPLDSLSKQMVFFVRDLFSTSGGWDVVKLRAVFDC
ncbi:hypothetical protein TIFTF001_039322 [Ficus carica]|uniref:Uncharacterized protein n=1 Tax=Ficus carica TaxID=3494 RepID=A0AA88EEI3_FICCA|nr:hypothetical protein TIFTF001_039319 [Ficus carica]GMN70277.1 hypothetical protein TIFTF001_039322 [Ficus carica]